MKNEKREGLLEIIAENDVFALGKLKKDRRNLTTGDFSMDYYVNSFIKDNIIYKVERGVYAKVGIVATKDEIKRIKFLDKRENLINKIKIFESSIDWKKDYISKLKSNELELFNILEEVTEYKVAEALCIEFDYDESKKDWYNFWFLAKKLVKDNNNYIIYKDKLDKLDKLERIV
jgi:hypothetical protein